jgi:hypothetical protein
LLILPAQAHNRFGELRQAPSQRKLAIFKFLSNVLLNITYGVKSILMDLSAYPFLRFLKGPADKLDNWLSNINSAREQREVIKRQLEDTKGKAASLKDMASGKEPGMSHEKSGGAGGASQPAKEPGTLQPGAVMSPAATAKPPGKSSDVHGTLMLDAFMQDANVPAEVREKWLQAAAAAPAQGAGSTAGAGLSGTLMMGSNQTLAPGSKAGAGQATVPELHQPPVTADVQTVSPDRTTPPAAQPSQASVYTADPYHSPAMERQAPPSQQIGWRDPEQMPTARWSEPAQAERGLQSTEMATAAIAAYAVPERPVIAAREMPAIVERRPEEVMEGERGYDWSTAAALATTIEEDQPALIPLAQRQQQLARLEYVCQCLRGLRQPLCPANGALVILPLQTFLAGAREMVELQKALKADLAAIQNQLKLRFPVTALTVGLEEDPGFEELVRRVGPERARSQRFGHRFDVRSLPVPGQLAALCVRISGVFEDWVYAIYRERGAIARRGNSHLFGMLCKVRTQLQERLMRVLCGGFGHDPQRTTQEEPIAFSGCYFAATGPSEDRRAFVAGVFDKLNEEQDNVEWTRQALREDRRFRRAGWFALGLTALTVAAVVVGAIARRL